MTWDIGAGLLVLCGLGLWFLTGGLIWARSKRHLGPRRERFYAAYVGGHPEVVVPGPTFCLLYLGARGLALRIRWAVVEIPFHHFTEAAADAWEQCAAAPAGMTDDCLRVSFTHPVLTGDRHRTRLTAGGQAAPSQSPVGEAISMYFAVPQGNAAGVAERVMEVFGEWAGAGQPPPAA